MTTKRHSSLVSGVRHANREESTPLSVENFLKALNSYPDRFAHDPQLSFEQHLNRVMAADQACRGGEGGRHAH